jgi:hypothetical protein
VHQTAAIAAGQQAIGDAVAGSHAEDVARGIEGYAVLVIDNAAARTTQKSLNDAVRVSVGTVG